MQVHILRPKKAAPYCGFSLRTLYNVIERDPTFPPKIAISPRCVGWRKEDLDRWLRSKEAA